MDNHSLEVRNQHELEKAISETDMMIMKKYMNDIDQMEIKEIDPEIADMDLSRIIRLNRIKKLVYDTDENNLEKLMNVYNAVGLCGGCIVNVIISDGKTVEYFIGTGSTNMNEIAMCQDTLVSALAGNYPGSSVILQKKGDLQDCMERIFGEEDKKVISVVSGIPGYRNKDNNENKKYVQGIERVIDSMTGKSFALITISTPVDDARIANIRDGYENLYSQLSPFAEAQLSYNESDSKMVSETITDGITKTIGNSLTSTVTNSDSTTKGKNESESFNLSAIILGGSITNGTINSTTNQKSNSKAESSDHSTADSHSIGQSSAETNTTGKTLQVSFENKSVKNLMKKIDDMIERIEDAGEMGLWNTATYCIADNTQTSRVLGSSVEAVCRGEKSTVENFAVSTWTDKKKRKQVKNYLKRLMHPVVIVPGNYQNFELNPTSLISGKELVIEAGLPQKSVPGLPVTEMTAFSRNVVNESGNESDSIKIGNIYHMGGVENTFVDLDVESLAAHTLITGSTGSGKSNTVYHILSELRSKNIKFLVVEPAKGEYKNVFGNESDVKVYGTNERYAELLRINPFKFPKSIHVLEHVDRLIEIFNVCWPMYAAMPAVLKDAVLSAYETCGWNLEESINEIRDDVFPTFKDLQREVMSVINKSAYSEEVKGNYIGSLATRIKSLTNGINGKIFTDMDLDYSMIFDQNVIIDLSRTGSVETKSLIMGLVVMALNEHRMDQSLNMMNQKLKHITVLEEAHNLLRNGASVISGVEVGGNLAGKSVEMISNSIAEMRTYGEGFIIVDQSPSAIDISAIRNTNTKIILRLPEENDRKQAGKSAALNGNQIDEIAKLQRGVAVVYQNNWLDPVLCSVTKEDLEEKHYSYKYTPHGNTDDCSEILKLLMKNRVDEKLELDIDHIERMIGSLHASTRTKIELRKIVEQIRNGQKPTILENDSFSQLSRIVVDILDCSENLDNYAEFERSSEMLQQELSCQIGRKAKDLSNELILAVSQCIMRQMVEKDSRRVEMYQRWREYAVSCK